MCRSTFLVCDKDGPPDEILVRADAAIIVGTGLVRAQHYGAEPYAFQYSHYNTAPHNKLVVDMFMGGSDSQNVALGNAVLYHMNNLCCNQDATVDGEGAIFRVREVGIRNSNGFMVRESVVRANLDLTRAMFIESERRLMELEYPLPEDLEGMLRMPVEFYYGDHCNSKVRWPVDLPDLIPDKDEDEGEGEDQRCRCLTMQEHG